MGDIIKGLWKWVFWILILLLLFAIILAIRIFIIDKDYKPNYSSSSNKSAMGKEISNAFNKGYDSGDDYNSFNFDEAFLMYEGEQNDEAVKDVLNHLIDNSKGNFYSRTSIEASGFGNDVTISYDGDVKKYQNDIQDLKNLVEEGMYEISFKYGGIGTYVNKIVVTKK